ncbi:DUF262 domain-containing protein [Streptomyces triculaminicus]|uniref:DUF262 domain-containing protein n=2 Tax=Streptomyces TaxID=1883 RepID=A0A939JPF8_9ACTN|nr:MULTISPECIES: DUF262 domain-containing protein [Streptomyces]MBO0652170.1 DUF262 domain-containing protein [Streptomyces triculaminicus]QSY46946.1 DUF262 domain-containing protein [Streptomyces griseocarneus]
MAELNDWDDADGEENSDPSEVRSDDAMRAVVTDTDWTTETILSQLRRGNIQLNPRFQRRDAWNKARKSRFVESLILGLPIPQIVLAEDKERRGKFIVLDGKQRLLAISQFASGSSFGSSSGEAGFRKFGLSGLEVRDDLSRMTLDKLESDPERVDDLNAFLNQTIRTVVVRSWPNEDFLNLVFLRLNTGSVSLSPQELRQALHPGEFTDYLDDAASSSVWLQKAFRIDRPDFRMRDVEVLLRFYAFHFRLSHYSGNLKKFLDETVQKLNTIWASDPTQIKDAAGECDRAIEMTFDIFGSDSFHRWSEGGYEGRFNRAVFDIMTYYFSRPEVRDALPANRASVKRAFEELCARDTKFVESIQTTTKTPEATHRRLAAWGLVLRDELGVPVRIPSFIDNRLSS